MPKQGRTDEYWNGVMTKFALGNYAFQGAGSTPGGRWKKVLDEEYITHTTNVAPHFTQQVGGGRQVVACVRVCVCVYA